jgi:TolB-like protein
MTLVNLTLPIRSALLILIVIGSVLASPIRAQDLDKETTGLAERLAKVLIAKGQKKVAVADFTDLQGRPTELGRFLAEQLSVELVNVPGISVVDRAHLKSILAEHQLTESGLINIETAKKLHQFAGVDALLLGTVASLDNEVVLTVKAISTETAEITAASKMTFQKTKEIQEFLVHGVGDDKGHIISSDSLQKPEAIATRDLGDLRVVLKSIQRVRVRGSWGPVEGIQCVFEFVNRNLNSTLTFAANGQKEDPMSSVTSVRGHITDENGNIFNVSQIAGITAIRVAGNGSPTAIVQTLRRGRKVEGGGYAYDNSPAWVGELSTISGGDSIQATMTFSPQDGRDDHSVGLNLLQFECEFVAGTGDFRSKDYRLHDLIFQGLKATGGDH